MIDFETEARKFQGFRYTEVYGVHQLLADFGEAMYEKALDDAMEVKVVNPSADIEEDTYEEGWCDCRVLFREAIRKLKEKK